MNKEILDCTTSVYVLGIREGLRRAAGMMRNDIVKRNRTDLYDITEYFASMLLVEANTEK